MVAGIIPLMAVSIGDDDIVLIRHIAGESGEALAQLYDRYGRLVYSLALRMLDDSAAAEEVTQDVFLQVWRGADGYDESQGKVVTWLTSFARHRAIDLLRRRNVRPEGHQSALEDFLDLSSPDQPTEPAVEAAMDVHNLRQALQTLPDDQRRVLAMAYFQGFTQQEIAVQMNEPLGTVKTRVRLGLKKLRGLLGYADE